MGCYRNGETFSICLKKLSVSIHYHSEQQIKISVTLPSNVAAASPRDEYIRYMVTPPRNTFWKATLYQVFKFYLRYKQPVTKILT
jgi:hypothetical protein